MYMMLTVITIVVVLFAIFFHYFLKPPNMPKYPDTFIKEEKKKVYRFIRENR